MNLLKTIVLFFLPFFPFSLKFLIFFFKYIYINIHTFEEEASTRKLQAENSRRETSTFKASALAPGKFPKSIVIGQGGNGCLGGKTCLLGHVGLLVLVWDNWCWLGQEGQFVQSPSKPPSGLVARPW